MLHSATVVLPQPTFTGAFFGSIPQRDGVVAVSQRDRFLSVIVTDTYRLFIRALFTVPR